MHRREFLKGAAALGIAGIGAAAGIPSVGARTRLGSTAPHVPVRDDLAALAKRLRGDVIVPGDGTYETSRLVFNPAYDYVHPAGIARVADVRDVRTVIEFAVDNDIAFVGRSGGHHMAGTSTGPGIVLDVTALDRIEPDLDAGTVSIGAGARLIDITEALRDTGRAIPSGSCPTVAIAGLALGGGIGLLTRKYGLTCDRLRGLDLVTADGQVHHVKEADEPDLFWASRGGGGGSFGIVTAFEFDLVDVDFPFTRYALAWPWAERAAAFAAWQEWAIESPLDTTGTCKFTTAAPDADAPAIEIVGLLMGPTDESEARIVDLERRVGTKPSTGKVDSVDYVRAEKDEFCQELRISECALETATPAGKLPRFGLNIKSDFMNAAWPDEAVAVITDWIERRQRDPVLTRKPEAMNLGKVWMEIMGGAAGTVAPTATAFAHRDAQFCVQFQSRWDVEAPDDVREANVEWLRGFYAAMAPWRSGSSYVSYPDPDLVDYEQAYFGENLDRLRAIKRAYDPTNVFTGLQSIRP